jgi:hypothetical protein
MQKQFEILNITRANVLKAIEGLTIEELNVIPSGFKNNIIWNVGHLVVTQQLLCYKLSGLDMYLKDDFVEKFKKGSEVNFKVAQEEVEGIKKQLLELPNRLIEDYSNSTFKNFAEYPTSYNFTLNSVEDAIQFNNVHEGLHFGYIMAVKKIICN